MNGSPHLRPTSASGMATRRGHWEGNTLVIDVTNFSPKTDFQGSRENLHLVERWTRTGPASLEYAVTIEESDRVDAVMDRQTRVHQTKRPREQKYYEPRCVEGNYSLPSLLLGARMEDLAFAEGRGPDPATKDNATDFVGVEEESVGK